MSRHAIVVLGMHRSGTSALTRVLGLLGGAMPLSPIPASADNPSGYWEPQSIARFNTRLLEMAGTGWNDHAAIPAEWFGSPERDSDRALARQLLETEFGEAEIIVFKDPRVCRLLPFWRSVFDQAAYVVHPILMLRNPAEVSRSLAARAAVEALRHAAVAATSRGLLLWLRYVLDAERHSRDLPRGWIDYHALLADWRPAIAAASAAAQVPLPPVDPATATAVDSFLRVDLRRQRDGFATDHAGHVGVGVLQGLKNRLVDAAASTDEITATCDALSAALDRLVGDHTALRRNHNPVAEDDEWSQAILAQLAEDGATQSLPYPL